MVLLVSGAIEIQDKEALLLFIHMNVLNRIGFSLSPKQE